MGLSAWGKRGLRGWGGWRGRIAVRLLPLLLTLAALLMLLAEHSLSPLLLIAGQEQARTRALAALTAAAQRQIAQTGAGDYRQLVTVERDEAGRVTLLLPDTALYNALIDGITLDAAASLEELSRQRLSLPAGAVTGSALLSGMGPELRFRLRVLGTPTVRVRDELTTAGINQVRHRIWLEVGAELRLLAPFSRETASVTAEVLLAEGVIVGCTPETYVALSRDEAGNTE